MKLIVNSTLKADTIVTKEWNKYLASNVAKGGRTATNTNCEAWYTTGQYMCRYSSYFSHSSSNPTVPGPLLSFDPNTNSTGILWGQGQISSYNTPSANGVACNNSQNTANYCNNYPAGCGPVAMAQVLWHMRPNSAINYAAMPQVSAQAGCNYTAPGDLALAYLMSACGSQAGSVYGFGGTCNTLTYPWNIPGALQGMGLSSGGTYSSFNPSIMKNELYQGYPIILKGVNSVPYIDGFDQHIWVCDGFNEHQYSEYNCDTGSCDEWSYLYFYMNWGWNGNGNAWYASGNFSPNVPNTGNFDQNVQMISGIRR